MDDLKVKIVKINDKAILPTYQTEGSAGMDLCACIDRPIIIKPMERRLILTGLAIELPMGYEMQIRARSGLSTKYGVTLINAVGTLDSDYRGEIGIPLVNLGQEDFTVELGMRIAQAVVAKHERVIWDEVNELSETERGAGGFGSTGK